MSRHKLIFYFLALVSVLFVVVVFYLQLPVFEGFEAKTYDPRFRTLRGPVTPHPDLAIIAIDEKTLAELGRFPFTRRNYTLLIDKVAAAGARALLMDAFFPEPEEPAIDREFANAIKRAGNVTLATTFEFDQTCTPVGMVASLPELIGAARAIGHINFQPDADGVNRQTPLLISYQDRLVPSLGLAGAMAGLGVPDFKAGDYDIQVGDRTIPLDANGLMLINFTGPPGVFPRYSFTDIVHGRIPAEALRGKVLFLGATALGIYDVRATPFNTNSPGVEVHANIADSIMRGAFIRRTGIEALVDLALIVGLGLAVFTITARYKPLVAVPVVVLLTAAHSAVVQAVFVQGYWLGVVYPMLSVLVSFIVSLLFRFIVLDRRSREMRSIFSSYVSSKIVDQLVSNPESAKIGGDSKTITILFADLRGFTTYSEKNDPYLVLITLNEYLAAMTRVIMDHDGTVDKFLGDGIMAYWGAPLAQKNHAELAIRCTLAMARAMEQLKDKWRAAGVPGLSFRIGLHTGEAIAGNIGAQGKKMEYTVIGDTVNLASRLEGTAKFYGVDILVSETTREAAGPAFVFRELDRIRVVGKRVPITIHELLGPVDAPDGPNLVARSQEFEQALGLYRDRRFAEARAAFAAILRGAPHDIPAQRFQERCAYFEENPPAIDWDGLFERKDK